MVAKTGDMLISDIREPHGVKATSGKTVTEALKKLSAMSYDERCRTKGLMPERADIIVAGIAILTASWNTLRCLRLP